MKSLQITGKAQMFLKPDKTRVTVTLDKTCADYGAALEQAAAAAGQIKDLFAGFGFAPEDVKTLRFNVETVYEGYEENGAYKQRLAGYRVCHEMKAAFASDSDLLGRVLYALSVCPAQPEFHIQYTVSDPEAARNELLARAVKDAEAKARVIAEAAGVKLKKIKRIEYAPEPDDLVARPVNGVFTARKLEAAGSLDLGLTPDDIAATDTVTVRWELD